MNNLLVLLIVLHGLALYMALHAILRATAQSCTSASTDIVPLLGCLAYHIAPQHSSKGQSTRQVIFDSETQQG